MYTNDQATQQQLFYSPQSIYQRPSSFQASGSYNPSYYSHGNYPSIAYYNYSTPSSSNSSSLSTTADSFKSSYFSNDSSSFNTSLLTDCSSLDNSSPSSFNRQPVTDYYNYQTTCTNNNNSSYYLNYSNGSSTSSSSPSNSNLNSQYANYQMAFTSPILMNDNKKPQYQTSYHLDSIHQHQQQEPSSSIHYQDSPFGASSLNSRYWSNLADNNQSNDDDLPLIETAKSSNLVEESDAKAEESQVNKSTKKKSKKEKIIQKKFEREILPLLIANDDSRKRSRTAFSSEQRLYLLSIFEKSRYPSKETLEIASNYLGVSSSTIQTWFKNTRSKQKKLTNTKNL